MTFCMFGRRKFVYTKFRQFGFWKSNRGALHRAGDGRGGASFDALLKAVPDLCQEIHIWSVCLSLLLQQPDYVDESYSES